MAGSVAAERFWRAAQTGDRIGPESTPVTIVVFSNYFCGFCRQFEPALVRLHARYPDQVAIIIKHYSPLLTRRALPLDLAADCAADQAKFPQFNHAVFRDTLLMSVPDRWLSMARGSGSTRPGSHGASARSGMRRM